MCSFIVQKIKIKQKKYGKRYKVHLSENQTKNKKIFTKTFLFYFFQSETLFNTQSKTKCLFSRIVEMAVNSFYQITAKHSLRFKEGLHTLTGML